MTSVALVVLDTVRKDSFDAQFDWLEGLSFENAWAPANWTVPVHAAMFTGQYPSEMGVHSKHKELDVTSPTLAEQLRDAGYSTTGFSANIHVSRHWKFDRGFERFQERSETGRFLPPGTLDWRGFLQRCEQDGLGQYLRALRACLFSECATLPSLRHGLELKFYDHPRFGELFETPSDFGAQSLLDELQTTDFGDREFLFVNLTEAHSPYRAPEAYRTVEPEESSGLSHALGTAPDSETCRQAYEDCVRYLSDRYREIFAELREDFDYIITCSDHGELFGEHGHWSHEYGLYPELTHVPLVISGSGLEDHCYDVVSLRAVYDTVLEIADDCNGDGSTSLLEDPDADACYTEYHGLLPLSRQSLVDEFGEQEVGKYDEPLVGVAMRSDYYGYETLSDVVETGDLEGERSPGERISERSASIVESLEEADVKSVPDDVRQRLEDLGYA